MKWIISVVLVILSWSLYTWYSYEEHFDADLLIRGQRVLVTGSTSGIGKATALEYCRLGAHVVFTGRNEEKLKDAVKLCKEIGGSNGNTYGYVIYDMNDLNNMHTLIKETTQLLGGIDYLIINHAHTGNVEDFVAFYGYTEQSYDVLQQLFDVNFFSYVKLLSHAMPHLKKSGGKVAVISSIYGQVPDILTGMYCASKHALEGLFRSLDMENYFLGTNVSITIIVPGFIDTTTTDPTSNSGVLSYLRIARELGFDPVKRFNDGHFNAPAPVQGCVDTIIKSTALRATEAYYPARDLRVWGLKLKYHMFPNWMKNIIRNYRV